MASWGTGPFECDEALDWFADVEAAPDSEVPALLAAAMAPGSGPGDRTALAAAVLTAHGCARAVRSGAPEVDEWLAAHRPTVDRALADAGLRVLDDAVAAGAVAETEPWVSGVRRALDAGPSRAQVTPLKPHELENPH